MLPAASPPASASASAERILDAAASCVRRTGSHRVAISAVARAAGLSRPTVYRYFPDGDALVRALWQRELTRLVADLPAAPADRATFVGQIVAIAEAVSVDETLAPTFAAQPSLMTQYIVERLGAGQRAVRERLRAGIASLQTEREVRADGVRAGEPDELATMTLLIAQSAIQSRRMVADVLPPDAWRRELSRALDAYLAP